MDCQPFINCGLGYGSAAAATADDDKLEMQVKTEHDLIASLTLRQLQQPAAFDATIMKSEEVEWMSGFCASDRPTCIMKSQDRRDALRLTYPPRP